MVTYPGCKTRISAAYLTVWVLLQWLRSIKPDNSEQRARDLLEAKSEILKLRAQLKHTEEERNILKNCPWVKPRPESQKLP